MTASTGTRHDGDSIHRALREDILSGASRSGEAMREVTLAERFGVSRTPVRQALGRLEQERLLERGARGLFVKRVDAREVVQVYDIRIMLEAECASQAALSRDSSDIARLQGLLERDQSLTDPSDRERTVNNLEFHSAIGVAAHNPVLTDLLQRLSSHLIHTPRSTLSVGNRWAEALQEHASILAAISDRDGIRASSLARRHMERAREIRLDLIRAEFSQPS
ncbi:GntR family transcriptional regulator [Cryobacterium sp. Y57]|uniref:GntR family transcriptional regulator n=1 Tax=Cryobacterium sp. Y57 TaxID=2048287 RepID=UPI000CE4C517|nr:GntR family transcriptional regulator [Cryobacterium sp. Y57]